MLEFCHSLTGAFLASTIPNPAISLPASLLSHFLLDLFPHWNPSLSSDKKKLGHLSRQTISIIFIDSFVGLILGLTLAYRKLPNFDRVLIVILGSFLAILPDLVEAPYYFFGWNNKYLQKLTKFQSKYQFKVSFWPGMISQLIFTLILLSLI